MSYFSNPNSNDGPSLAGDALLQVYWQEFISLVPSEDDGFECLYNKLSGDDRVSCKECGCRDIEKDHGARFGLCASCKTSVWYTAGTFFDHIRLSRPWLFAIWLREKGVAFSPSGLARVTGIAYSTAWAISKRIDMVLQSVMDTEPIAVQVASARFAPAIGKRSRETPANEHPVAEQAEFEKRIRNKEIGMQPSVEVEACQISPAKAEELSEQEEDVYKLLSIEPVHFDSLCKAVTMPIQTLSSVLITLELYGFVDRLPGDCYIRSTPVVDNRIDSQSSLGDGPAVESGMIGRLTSIIDFIRGLHHGISRKYLQLYLAAYWCQVDRSRWSVGTLLQACCRYKELKLDDILAFVSPLLVKVMPY